MQPRAGLMHGSIDGSVNGKLIAPRVDAQLQILGQAELADGPSDHRQIVAEFSFELDHVAHVIDPFVEPAGEFRSDRLQRHALGRERRQDEQQIDRRLRPFGFIHRDLGHEPVDSFRGCDMPIDLPRLLRRREIFSGDLSDSLDGDFQWIFNARHTQPSRVFYVSIDKFLDRTFVGRTIDEIGDIQGEEIARIEKAINGLQADVVGIDEVRPGPSQGPHGIVGFGSDAGGRAMHDQVFAVRFVPNRRDLNAQPTPFDQRRKLCPALMGKSIADAETKSRKLHDAAQVKVIFS